MQLTTIFSVLITCAGTATAALAGIEPMFYRFGTMDKRDTLGPVKRHCPGDADPPNGWSAIDKNSGCKHKCCSSNDGVTCSGCCLWDPNDPAHIHNPKTSKEYNKDEMPYVTVPPCEETHSC